MLRWLTGLLGWVPRDERTGVALAPGACWRVTAPHDHAVFVRALHELLPPESVVFIEGGSSDDAINRAFATRATAPDLKIARGTIWPRRRIIHVPATLENLTLLAELCTANAAVALCEHFHAYHGQQILLQWHDAFCRDPLYLAHDIPEGKVKAFCQRCGCVYELEGDGIGCSH